MPTKMISATVVDVNGSFARFLREAPKVARKQLAAAVAKSTDRLAGRMIGFAPVGPDAPHIRDEIKVIRRGLVGRAGIFDNDEQAHVALYNEYAPNLQPFMMPAALLEATAFTQTVKDALQMMASDLERG